MKKIILLILFLSSFYANALIWYPLCSGQGMITNEGQPPDLTLSIMFKSFNSQWLSPVEGSAYNSTSNITLIAEKPSTCGKLDYGIFLKPGETKIINSDKGVIIHSWRFEGVPDAKNPEDFASVTVREDIYLNSPMSPGEMVYAANQEYIISYIPATGQWQIEFLVVQPIMLVGDEKIINTGTAWLGKSPYTQFTVGIGYTDGAQPQPDK